MSIVSINWSFIGRQFMPIVDVIGESQEKESKQILLQKAVEIIEYSAKFKGKVYVANPSTKRYSNIYAHFSLIFPSNIYMEEFLRNTDKIHRFKRR